jgi:hypothetical protein
MVNKFFNLILIFSIFFITSCGIYRPAPVKDNPINDREKREKNIKEGKGITVFGKNLGNKGAGNFVFASSNPMWRATLKTLDFTPLSNVDYSGGVIISDWYSENNPKESVKISVRFLSEEIRADGIDVKIFKKKCDENLNCNIKPVTSSLNKEIKMAILKEAAIIELADKKKRFEDSGRDVTLIDPKE